jgi:hypothetical protein
LLACGVLVATPACDSGDDEDAPGPVNLPPGTFEVAFEGATDTTLEGAATYQIDTRRGQPDFVVNLSAEPAQTDFTAITLVRPGVSEVPPPGAYSAAVQIIVTVIQTSGFNVSTSTGGTVHIAAVEEDALTGRLDVQVSNLISGAKTSVQGAFHAVRDTSSVAAAASVRTRAAFEQRFE